MDRERSQKYTSERVDLDAYSHTANDHLVACMHLATYEFARPYTAGRQVLDFGCGTGYGVRELASDTQEIVGVDIDPSAIHRAKEINRHPHASFLQIPPVEAAPLPFDNGQFDTVLSFQVIEHVRDAEAYLREVRRVLRQGGTFVCATPDRRVRLRPGQRPWNAHHVIEYAPDDLRAQLEPVFDDVQFFSMATTPASLADIELARYRRIQRLSAPFTWHRAPEWWRQRGLGAMKFVHGLGRPWTRQTAQSKADFGFGPRNIRINAGVDESLNIVVVAT